MDFTESITWKLGSQPVIVFLSICGQDADAGIKSRNQLRSGRKGEDVKFYEFVHFQENDTALCIIYMVYIVNHKHQIQNKEM